MARLGNGGLLGVAIVSHNEAHLLVECLASVGPVDVLVVLDMESVDDTVAVAQSMGATVVPVPKRPVVEQVRQLGHDALGTEWVLWLDPDERAPSPVRDLLLQHLGPAAPSGFFIPFRDQAFGVTTRHMNPSAAKIALLRTRDAWWDAQSGAHVPPVVQGPVQSLVGVIPPFTHLAYQNVEQVLEKTVRYGRSRSAANTDRDARDPLLLPRLLWSALITRGALSDGSAGAAAASMSAYGDYLAALFAWEEAGYPQRTPSRVRRLGVRLLQRAVRDGRRIRSFGNRQ